MATASRCPKIPCGFSRSGCFDVDCPQRPMLTPPPSSPSKPDEIELRTWALQMAVDRTPVGDFTDDTVKRAAAFLKFLKGDQS